MHSQNNDMSGSFATVSRLRKIILTCDCQHQKQGNPGEGDRKLLHKERHGQMIIAAKLTGHKNIVNESEIS